MFRTTTLCLMLAAAAPSPASAQLPRCDADGPILVAEPVERVTIGPDGVEREALSAESGVEFQAVVTCAGGRLVYASRQNHEVRVGHSGCFAIYGDDFGNSIHALDTTNEACRGLFGDAPHDYSEVIRSGVYQIIYRGRIRLQRSPFEGRRKPE